MPARDSRYLMPAHGAGTPGFQFRIVLEHVEPVVWRRVVVSADATFWSLHAALNDAMGWQDSHLHEFEVVHPVTREVARIGIPDPEGQDDHLVIACWTVPLAEFLRTTGTVFRYFYDFGDGWEHEVHFESLVPRPLRGGYDAFPRVTGGERACPPEDCGGPGGYAHLLSVLANPAHPEHRELKRWAPRRFDPARFNAAKVEFHDAGVRLRRLLSEMRSS